VVVRGIQAYSSAERAPEASLATKGTSRFWGNKQRLSKNILCEIKNGSDYLENKN
jgi:hypothetical protein